MVLSIPTYFAAVIGILVAIKSTQVKHRVFGWWYSFTEKIKTARQSENGALEEHSNGATSTLETEPRRTMMAMKQRQQQGIHNTVAGKALTLRRQLIRVMKRPV